jgi:hypothetical protein
MCVTHVYTSIEQNVFCCTGPFGTASAIIYNNRGNNTDGKKFYHVVSDVLK